MFDIADNADDFYPRIAAADLHTLAERILPRPVTLRSSLVNQHDERRVTVILRCHESPFEQGNFHRLKIVRRDSARKNTGPRLRQLIDHFGASLDDNARASKAAGDRQSGNRAYCLHAGQGVYTLAQLLKKTRLLFRLRVARGRQRDLCGHQVPRIESQLNMLYFPEAADHQPRADEQHDCQGDLGYNKNTSSELSVAAGTYPAFSERIG